MAIGRWQIKPVDAGRTLGLRGAFEAARQSFSTVEPQGSSRGAFFERQNEPLRSRAGLVPREDGIFGVDHDRSGGDGKDLHSPQSYLDAANMVATGREGFSDGASAELGKSSIRLTQLPPVEQALTLADVREGSIGDNFSLVDSSLVDPGGIQRWSLNGGVPGGHPPTVWGLMAPDASRFGNDGVSHRRTSLAMTDSTGFGAWSSSSRARTVEAAAVVDQGGFDYERPGSVTWTPDGSHSLDRAISPVRTPVMAADPNHSSDLEKVAAVFDSRRWTAGPGGITVGAGRTVETAGAR